MSMGSEARHLVGKVSKSRGFSRIKLVSWCDGKCDVAESEKVNGKSCTSLPSCVKEA